MKKPVAKPRKKHGIRVFRSGACLTQAIVDKTIRKIRREHEKRACRDETPQAEACATGPAWTFRFLFQRLAGNGAGSF
jgi:hypothetical protein